jgi:hypothetical protein
MRRFYEDHQMSNTNTGGPAFPNEGGPGNLWNEKGMTLRDYFAAKAMQGIICTPINEYDDGHAAVYLSDGLSFSDGMRGRIAVASYAMADAMLKARQA